MEFKEQKKLKKKKNPKTLKGYNKRLQRHKNNK